MPERGTSFYFEKALIFASAADGPGREEKRSELLKGPVGG